MNFSGLQGRMGLTFLRCWEDPGITVLQGADIVVTALTTVATIEVQAGGLWARGQGQPGQLGQPRWWILPDVDTDSPTPGTISWRNQSLRL